MRPTVLILAGTIALAAAAAANAAPAIPNPGTQQSANVVHVAGGCGPGLHPNHWGHCVPFRYGYYRPRPYWRSGYYRPWRWSDDYAAEQLNHQELGRIYGYGY